MAIKFLKSIFGCKVQGIIQIKLHRPITGKIKTVSVKREGGWYACFSVECELMPLPTT
jgi:putative transposase